MGKQATASIIQESMIILNNSSSVEIVQTTMARYGYTQEKIAEGLALLDGVTNLCAATDSKKGASTTATKTFNNLFAELTLAFRRHRKLAKVCFQFHAESLTKLGLTGKLSQSYLPCIASAELFYERLASDSDLLNALNPLAITAETVAEMKRTIVRVKERKWEQVCCQAEYDTVVLTKNSALKTLRQWIVQYMKVVEVAASESGSDEIISMLRKR